MSSNPTLVFIPGSWHKPICYDPVIRILQDQHNLKCTAVTLPSTSNNPAATFKDDVDAARAAIAHETNQGRNVVVIAHSYGGMVGNSAIKGFTKEQQAVDVDLATATATVRATGADTPTQHASARKTTPIPTPGHIIGLILIASGFTFTGVTFMAPFLNRPPPAWRVNNQTGYAELVTPPAELFYHDLPPESAGYWTSQLTTQSLKALFEGGEHAYAGWKDVPVWYIGTVEDRGLPVLAQRMSVGMARGMGGKVEHRELCTSHSPFLSQPEATVGIVVEAVGAFMGESESRSTGNGEMRRNGGRRDVGTTPGAVLGRPLTWLRFGLPLAFGHFVGKGILVAAWGKRMWRTRFGLRSV